MNLTVQELTSIINEYTQKIAAIPDLDFLAKQNPRKWSKQEVLGHLIDSAQNNLRRFICGQYEPNPSKIVYDQDFWVSSNGYQDMSKEDVIQLWRLINQRIAAVLTNMPHENYGKLSETSALHSLEWLAADYVKHMKHHLNQIIAGSFDVVYR
jgi:hypothetical protein